MAEIKSILTSTKQTLGLAEDYTVFDQDVLMHINTALGTLNQLGVGPGEGLSVWDADVEWDDLLGGNPKLNMARSYVFLQVRLLFDSSNLSGPVLDSIKKEMEKLEWRLMVHADPPLPTVPVVPAPPDEVLYDPSYDVIIDGGSID